jgi:hypothetical protein
MMIAWRFQPRIPARDILQGAADFSVILRADINLVA